MSVLVVGGAGYIGSAMVELLIAAGEGVVVLDNLSRGHRQAIHPRAIFIQGDMADYELVTSTLKKYKCDVVMHFSALSLVSESVQTPLLYYENNVARGIELVKAMLSAGVNKLIFSSTAAVYGAPQTIPITEDVPPEPVNPYGRSKLQFEQFLADCSKAHGLRYVALRYFNAAGATENYGEDHRPETHLIPLILQVAAGKRGVLEVYGNDYPTPDGTCIRDYIHIIDLATAHLLALQHLRQDKVSSAVYNLGNNRGFSVLEVIQIAEKVTGKKIPYIISPRRAGDPPVLIASSEKIKRELGWAPHYQEIEQIVADAWRWQQKFPAGYEE